MQEALLQSPSGNQIPKQEVWLQPNLSSRQEGNMDGAQYCADLNVSVQGQFLFYASSW